MKSERDAETVQRARSRWILTADRRRARLLSCSRTEHGRLHLEPSATLEEEWDEVEHGRPSPRSGKDGHGYASRGHEEDERTHRFAVAVSRWLEQQISERGIESMEAFCAPRLLGPLRSALSDHTRRRLSDHALDLSSLTPGELATHDAILAAAC